MKAMVQARGTVTHDPGLVRRRRLRRLAAVVVVLALAFASAYALGYRLNLTTSAVARPTATSTPEQVVTTYVDAYNHRDWDTMAAIYPTSEPDRFRAIGTMSDLTIVSSQALASAEDGNPPVPGRNYHRVRVTVDLSGLTGSDLAYAPGPNGWAYLLERDSVTEPWRIVDHGNP